MNLNQQIAAINTALAHGFIYPETIEGVSHMVTSIELGDLCLDIHAVPAIPMGAPEVIFSVDFEYAGKMLSCISVMEEGGEFYGICRECHTPRNEFWDGHCDDCRRRILKGIQDKWMATF